MFNIEHVTSEARSQRENAFYFRELRLSQTRHCVRDRSKQVKNVVFSILVEVNSNHTVITIVIISYEYY